MRLRARPVNKRPALALATRALGRLRLRCPHCSRPAWLPLSLRWRRATQRSVAGGAPRPGALFNTWLAQIHLRFGMLAPGGQRAGRGARPWTRAVTTAIAQCPARQDFRRRLAPRSATQASAQRPLPQALRWRSAPLHQELQWPGAPSHPQTVTQAIGQRPLHQDPRWHGASPHPQNVTQAIAQPPLRQAVWWRAARPRPQSITQAIVQRPPRTPLRWRGATGFAARIPEHPTALPQATGTRATSSVPARLERMFGVLAVRSGTRHAASRKSATSVRLPAGTAIGIPLHWRPRVEPAPARVPQKERPAPVTLAWRKSAPDAGVPDAGRELRPAAAPARAIPEVAVTPAGMKMAAAAAVLEPALVERLTDDVVRRVERRVRIERERRGL